MTVQDASSHDFVQGARVTFNQETDTTGQEGQVVFRAPTVDADTSFVITAIKDGYISTSTEIIVRDTEDTLKGYFFGIVTGAEGTPLQDVTVCVKDSTSLITITCIQTNEQGSYVAEVPPGSYKLTATKQEYLPKTVVSTVQEFQATEVNFYLIEQSTDMETTSDVYFIREQAAKGNVGGNIKVTQQGPIVESYLEDLTFDTKVTDNVVTCTVSGEGPGTIVAFNIQIFESEDLQIRYDGSEITRVTDIELFFNNQESLQSSYAQYGDIYFVRIPSFSTHTITIQTVLADLTAIILFYIAIAVVIALLFVGSGEISKRL